MSFFGDFGVEGIGDAPDDPFSLPDGTYRGAVIKGEVRKGEKNNDAKTKYAGLAMTLSATGESRTHQHYMPMPMPGDTPDVIIRKKSTIKKFMQGLGIPESRMDTTEIADMIAAGQDVVFTIRTGKNGFRNLEIKLANGAGAVVGEPTVSMSVSTPAVGNADFGL